VKNVWMGSAGVADKCSRRTRHNGEISVSTWHSIQQMH